MIKMVEICNHVLQVSLQTRISYLPLLHQKPKLEGLLKHPSNCLICIWIKLKNEVGGLDFGWEPKCTVTIWAGAGVAVNEMFWGLMEWSKIWSSFFKCPTCCQTTTRLFLNGTAHFPHHVWTGNWRRYCCGSSTDWDRQRKAVIWLFNSVSFSFTVFLIPSPLSPKIRAHGPFEHIPGGFAFGVSGWVWFSLWKCSDYN